MTESGAMARAAAFERLRVLGPIRRLPAIAESARLSGTLGCVFGIVCSFKGLSGEVDVGAVYGENLGLALACTALGLCVSLWAIVLHRWLYHLASALIAELDPAVAPSRSGFVRSSECANFRTPARVSAIVSAESLQFRHSLLPSVIATAPLAGALGTWAGFLDTLRCCCTIVSLSGGLATALFPAAFGLAVAILAYGIHRQLIQCAESLVLEMETAAGVFTPPARAR